MAAAADADSVHAAAAVQVAGVFLEARPDLLKRGPAASLGAALRRLCQASLDREQRLLSSADAAGAQRRTLVRRALLGRALAGEGAGSGDDGGASDVGGSGGEGSAGESGGGSGGGGGGAKAEPWSMLYQCLLAWA